MAKCMQCGASGFSVKLDSFGLCPACQAMLRMEYDNRIQALQAFQNEYSCIPDARKAAEAILADARKQAADILRDAELKGEKLLKDAAAKAEKETAKLESVKRNCQEAVAVAEMSIAGLLASASKDFSDIGRQTISVSYTNSVKKNALPNTAHDAYPLTPSEFKKYAKKGYVVFDLETTGLRSHSDRIIEIGAIKYDGQHNEIDRFSAFVNPKMRIPAAASAVNHITDSMVASAPEIADVLPDFFRFFGSLPLIAHNAGFDAGFLQAEADRCSLSEGNFSYADSLTMARKKYNLPNHKLGTIAEHLQIPVTNAHRAIGDCETLGAIVKDLLS